MKPVFLPGGVRWRAMNHRVLPGGVHAHCALLIFFSAFDKLSKNLFMGSAATLLYYLLTGSA